MFLILLYATNPECKLYDQEARLLCQIRNFFAECNTHTHTDTNSIYVFVKIEKYFKVSGTPRDHTICMDVYKYYFPSALRNLHIKLN